MLECVINVSEGRRPAVIESLAEAAGGDLLDVHRDRDHHRTVLTVVGEDAPRAVARVALATIDLRRHTGVHPRLGAVDVVPFAPLAGATQGDAVAARDRFGRWLGDELAVPAFAYGGDGPPLPLVRREAFHRRAPSWGPARPHPTAGAAAVGARPVLVAYNVWLAADDVGLAREVASAVRGPGIRALGLPVGGRAQVSMNLIEPARVGPAVAYDLVARLAEPAGAELVGLLPEAVLRAVPEARWEALDLGPDRTIEHRLAARPGAAPSGC